MWSLCAVWDGGAMLPFPDPALPSVRMEGGNEAGFGTARLHPGSPVEAHVIPLRA